MTADDLLIHHRNEAAARKPWLYAESESWWVVTGYVNEQHTFQGCIAQVVPEYVTGVDDGDGPALFAVHTWGGKPLLVDADKISHASRLVFVLADEPTTAHYLREQEFLTSVTSPEVGTPCPVENCSASYMDRCETCAPEVSST